MTLLVPEQIDISQLPSLPFGERNALPNCAAVYFVLDADANVLYIGRAKSLCFRWQGHHKLAQFTKLSGVRIAWLSSDDPILLPVLEDACITHFQPRCNYSARALAPEKQHDVVTLHLKVERCVRDQLLGKLRSQGMTMQHFFETLMQGLIADEKALEEVQETRRRYARSPTCDRRETVSA